MIVCQDSDACRVAGYAEIRVPCESAARWMFEAVTRDQWRTHTRLALCDRHKHVRTHCSDERYVSMALTGFEQYT